MKITNIKKSLSLLIVGMALIALTLTACTASPPQAEPESPVAEASGEVQRVSLEESLAAFDRDEAVFLDVRSESAYAASHIPGALSIPLAELEARINEIDSNQWIITYCT
jgi:3-mercaptopyruvate sulfurtransferase SseA